MIFVFGLNIIIFECLKIFVLVATASTMKVWGNFSPFSFNKFGLKSHQVEFVDFEYHLNEEKKYQIKLSNEDTAKFTHLQLHLYFETV